MLRGLDPHEQAQQPHSPERLEDAALGVARAALQDQADVPHVAGAQRGVDAPDPVAVVRGARHEEVVVVEHELADAVAVEEARHLVGDVLRRPLPEARPGREPVERRDAAVVARADAAAAPHEIGGRDAAQEPRRAGAVGPRQPIRDPRGWAGEGRARPGRRCARRRRAPRRRGPRARRRGSPARRASPRPRGGRSRRARGGRSRSSAAAHEAWWPPATMGRPGEAAFSASASARNSVARTWKHIESPTRSAVRAPGEHGGSVGPRVERRDLRLVAGGPQRRREVQERQVRFVIGPDEQDAHWTPTGGRGARRDPLNGASGGRSGRLRSFAGTSRPVKLADRIERPSARKDLRARCADVRFASGGRSPRPSGSRPSRRRPRLRQRRTSTTSLPRTLPARMSDAAGMAPASGISWVMASSFAGSRSRASLDHASSRSGLGAITLSIP